MNRVIYSSWDCNPPNIVAISQPLPDAPRLPLSGGCTTRMSLKKFLEQLEKDFKYQQGQYFAYVMGAEKEEADTYALATWEIYASHDSCYEAIVVLYYAPLNPYLTYKKHMGDRWAEEYLKEQAIAAS